MRRIIVACVFSLLACALSVQTSNAADESIPCIPEPTNMAIAYGSVIACSIGATGADSDIFMFNGNARDTIVVLASLRSGSNFEPCIELFTPTGTRIGLGCGFSASNRIDATLPNESGTYSIRVSDTAVNGTGTYTLALGRVAPPAAATPIYVDRPLVSTIDPIGDLDPFFFNGRSGGNLIIQATRTAVGTNFEPCIELFAPNGTRIGLGCGFSASNRIDVQLTQTGFYTIQVSDTANNGLGPYTLSLECVSEPCPLRAPVHLCAGRVATIVGTNIDDVLVGTLGADVIVGLGGNDVIYGLGGNDIICGGLGDDRLSGGPGIDWLFGETGNDVLQGDSESDILRGGTGNDTLNGGIGNDQLLGDAGNDTLDGGLDSNLLNIDILRGGDGNDALNGGTGNDQLVGDAGNDTLDGGTENDIVRGNAGNDTLNGGIGNDQLLGDAGNDTLDGGSGNDRLSGGGGLDVCDGNAGLDLLILPVTCEEVINTP
jgi:hypothetical protein